MPLPVTFWLYARCQYPGCEWHVRMEAKKDFDAAITTHRKAHTEAGK